MAKHKRNKRYTPRLASSTGNANRIFQLLAAVEDREPLDPHAMTDLGIAYWVAYHMMLNAEKPTEEHWTMITVTLNAALILCERGFEKDGEPYIVKAMDGAMRAKMRAKGLGVWRYDGNAIAAIREALEIHDEQVEAVTKGDIRAAFIEVKRRINEGNAYQEAA